MCGITGIVDFNSSHSGVNRDVLKKMSDVIIHRGPDSDGQWISKNRKCGFSFRRLSIIDLSSDGNQPMSTPDGRFTIVFNGEIYNHSQIREELIERGYKYNSNTDTETILYGFAEFGPEIVDKLQGMWGFAIWDSEKEELFCSRDRIGIKPLYFSYSNGRFIFGSEIKSILQHPTISKELNLFELTNYLNYGMSGNRNSLFKGIHKIPAGHFLILKENGELFKKRYWSPLPKDQPYTEMNQTEVQEHTVKLLRTAIKDRMMSDVPFGVFLSGGIDSSLNVALMNELMDRPIDTYTVGFKELEKYNELKYARQISKQFGTNHNEILIDEKDSFPILEDLVWHEDEPNADPVCIPLWFLSKLTRDSGTTVVQVGEGSDEQFVGYPWMMREYNFYRTYWKFYTAMPDLMKQMAFKVLDPMLTKMNQDTVLEYFRRSTFNDQLYWGGSSIYSPTHFKRLLTEEHQNLGSIPSEYAKSLHQQAKSFKKDADYLQRILFVELSERLSEILLMRVDKIGMAHSIEARVPFLDHRLVEFTMSIPPKLKTPDNKTTKYVLKKAIEGILPDNIIYRKKQGFWAPVNEWLRNDWYDFARNEVMNSYFVQNQIFDKSYVQNLFDLHKSGKRNLGLKLFTLLTLSIWHKRHFQ